MERKQQRSKGQSVVELALLMPFLLWICAGTVDFGRVYYYDIVMINAARSGARAAADTRNTDAQVRTAVKADASPVAVSDVDIAVSPSTTRVAGDTVTVTVTYRFSAITPLVGAAFPGGQLTASRSASMVAF